jgi:hypothetical protein
MITKSLLVLVVLALLVSVVSAVSINVEDPMTQGSQWSFTVNFDSLDNVDEGKIYVNDELALTVFEHSGQVFVADVSSKVLSNNINGTSVVVAYTGLNEGTHSIQAKKFISGNIDNEQSISFSVIKPLSQSEKQSLVNQINALEVTTSNLNATTGNLKTEISTLETALGDRDLEINTLKQKNSELLDEINQIELNIVELETAGATNEEIISDVKDDLNLLLFERAEAKKSPLTGLFAAGASSSTLLLALIAVIAVIVIGVFLKKNSSSIYSSSIFSKNDEMQISTDGEVPEAKIINEPQTELVEDAPTEKKKGFFSRFKKSDDVEVESSLPKRKWAVESYHPAENEKKEKDDSGFELGDLIKK